MDLALNNLQRLIYYKTQQQTNKIKCAYTHIRIPTSTKRYECIHTLNIHANNLKCEYNYIHIR